MSANIELSMLLLLKKKKTLHRKKKKSVHGYMVSPAASCGASGPSTTTKGLFLQVAV